MTLEAVETTAPPPARARVTGAGMDRPLRHRRPNRIVVASGALLLLGGIAALWRLLPSGLRVADTDMRIATVQKGMLSDEVVVRSTAEPLHTIMLDALELGRVEEVLVNDGALVAKGALLFRLSNPQLRLNLLARESDRAEQISNLSTLRVSIETSQTEHQRRLLELNFARAQAERLFARNSSLMKTGVISVATFEESRDRLEQQQQFLYNEKTRHAIETRIKRDGVTQMEQAIEQLDAGLTVVTDSIEALAVRAPIAGRLTDFRLQLGQIVKSEQRLGRIDDPSKLKLKAHVDEYFLGRLVPGKTGSATVNGRGFSVEVSRVYPQITNGQFLVELLFTTATPPEMNPGQSAETRIILGEAKPGLLLPNDAFLSDTGGAWVFVLDPDGRSAQRRPIRVGHHSNRQVEIVSGVAPGERVIVSTYADFGDAQQLQISR